MTEKITRPNGTIYRPRHIRTTFFGDEDEPPTQLAVFGTAIRAESDAAMRLALSEFNNEWGYAYGVEAAVDGEPKVEWYSRRLSHFEDDVARYHYEFDTEKGAHAYVYPVREVEVPPTLDPTVQTVALFEPEAHLAEEAGSRPPTRGTVMVKVFVKPSGTCVQCDATHRALDAKGIEYEVVDLADEQALAEVKALGYLQAPVVITDDGHWSGFRPDKIDELAARLRGRA